MTKEHWDVIRAEFITSAVRAEQYPKPYLPEVAFIGRSNVGKSSLINSVCRRNGLARVSSSPGKTQTLNFYRLDAKRVTEQAEDRTQFYLVDLPGYGFAKTNHKNKEQWSGFIRKYLEEAPNLALICQLMDIRHNLMDSDGNAAMSQRAAFKKALGLADEQITAYSVLQPTMRLDFINRIMAALTSDSEVTLEE